MYISILKPILTICNISQTKFDNLNMCGQAVSGFYHEASRCLTVASSVNSAARNTNGIMGILYTDIDKKTRLPYYHRMDITLKKKFYIGENSELQTQVSITNIYNRENIFYVDRVTNERINQLPIMPSIGLSLTF